MTKKNVWIASLVDAGNDCGAAAVSGISEGHGEMTSPQRQAAEVKIDNFVFGPQTRHGTRRNDSYLDQSR